MEGDLPERRPYVVPGHQVVGRVVEHGPPVPDGRPPPLGARVGVAWLHRTCGVCRPCRAGREDLCERAEFTVWSVDGGYAEHVVAPAGFDYPLPEGLDDLAAAPLPCAGIIGVRALSLTGLGADRRGARLGI